MNQKEIKEQDIAELFLSYKMNPKLTKEEDSIDEALTLDCPCAIRYPSGTENTEIVERFYKGKKHYSWSR